jgi:Electron transfer DM13
VIHQATQPRVDRCRRQLAGTRSSAAGPRVRPATGVGLPPGGTYSIQHELWGATGNRRVLTLTRLETDDGLDLRVYVTTADASRDSTGEAPIGSGAPKGNVGDQQYELPRDTDLDCLTKIVIRCRAFSAGFGAAALPGL